MKTLLTILLLFVLQNSFGQTSNAGADQTIYLTQSNSVNLDGSASSATSYQWREVSTDFSSGGTITSPTSKTTTVTGLLKQGTFYFELAATTGGVTKKDSMVLRVNYEPLPAYASLYETFGMNLKTITDVINWRGDTTSFFPDSDAAHSQCGDGADFSSSTQWWFLYRDRVNAIDIDSLRGKMTTKIEDGYGNGSVINGTQVKYPRTEVVMDKPGVIDTSHIYMFEWKGYYPQQTNYMTGNNAITTIFQIHTNSSTGENFTDFSLRADGTLVFTLFPNGPREEKFAVGTLSDWTNKSHTIRLTTREGYGAPGNPAFVRVEIDGVQMLLRDTGRIGGTDTGDFSDFAKFGTLYDFGNAMVDANAPKDGKKFSLVTENYSLYTMTSYPPLVNAGKNQIILTPNTSATLVGTVTQETSAIASHMWTQVSGNSCTITSPNSLSTTVTGLTKGIYVFNLQATDISGLTSNSTVQITVEDDPTIAATGYNYDVLVDGVLNGTVSSLRNHDMDGSGYSLFVQGFSPNSTALPYGLPTNGIIISPTNARYQLQSYNTNNTLWLNNAQSGTLTLSSPAKFNKIKIALTSGGSSVSYKINYSDGSNDVVSHTINNWACQGCSAYAINSLGRVDATGTVDASYWAIYEDSLSPNPSKTVNSITFTSTGSWVSIFALTNVLTPPTISMSANQPNVTVDHTSVSAVGTPASGQTITGYTWTKVSGASVTFGTPNSASTTVTGLTTGTYVLRCTVTQSDGQTAYGEVTITVNIPVVSAPTANAGTNQTITLPTSTVNLSGSYTTASGHTATVLWTKVSGSGTQTIFNNTTLTPSISGLTTAGSYVFQLKVTQDDSQFATSTVTITVNTAPPVVDAGQSFNLKLPTKLINH